MVYSLEIDPRMNRVLSASGNKEQTNPKGRWEPAHLGWRSKEKTKNAIEQAWWHTIFSARCLGVRNLVPFAPFTNKEDRGIGKNVCISNVYYLPFSRIKQCC